MAKLPLFKGLKFYGLILFPTNYDLFHFSGAMKTDISNLKERVANMEGKIDTLISMMKQQKWNQEMKWSSKVKAGDETLF